MNRNSFFIPARVVFAGACMILCASAIQAGPVSFHVDINTGSLVSNANGPFSLDFQLNQGAGAATNTVTVSHFAFTAGNPAGSAALFGGATGSLSSSVSLTDSANAFNEFYQGFSAGTTAIDFDVFMTSNVDPTTPDVFSMAILDSNLANIPTTGLADSLLLVNINVSNLSPSDLQTFTSTSPDAGVTVAATPTPEPGTVGMALVAGLIALGWSARGKTARLLKNCRG